MIKKRYLWHGFEFWTYWHMQGDSYRFIRTRIALPLMGIKPLITMRRFRV